MKTKLVVGSEVGFAGHRGEITALKGGWASVLLNGSIRKVRTSKLEPIVEKPAPEPEPEPVAKPKSGGHPMMQLREARHHYTRGVLGLNCNDDIAELLDGIPPFLLMAEVVRLVAPDAEGRWNHLNPGQQRMCFGNRIRRMIRNKEATFKDVASIINTWNTHRYARITAGSTVSPESND